MAPGNPKYRYIYAAWGFLECLGFGGLIYGWGSLVFVLKDEGLYLDLCDKDSGSGDATTLATAVVAYGNSSSSSNNNNTGGLGYSVVVEEARSCYERDSKLALVFTIAGAMFCVACFAMGQVNFYFGTRITRLCAAALFIVGGLMVAFTSNDIPWLIFPGLSLVGGGGITYLMTNAQISLLFPAGGSAVVGLFCGGFDASSGIQLMVKLGHENGISRSTSYIILSCAHLMTLVSTFFFMPKDFIKKPSEAGAVKHSKQVADKEETGVELIDPTQNGEDKEESSDGPIPSFRSCLLSPSYIIHVAWLAILQLRFYFLLGSLNTTLEMRLDSHDEVSSYTNVMMYILMCGLFTSPFAGMVYDFHIRMFKDSQSKTRRQLMPAVIPLALTTVLCILLSGVILIETPEILYLVFVLVLFFRSFLYTMGAGFISNIFPNEYFGMLYGILILVGGIVSFFQYVFFEWAEAASFNQVNVFLLIMVCVTFVHPIYQWWVSRRAEQSLIVQE